MNNPMSRGHEAAIKADDARQTHDEGGADARLIDVFTRRETATERRARISRKRVDPATAAALRRMWAA